MGYEQCQLDKKLDFEGLTSSSDKSDEYVGDSLLSPVVKEYRSESSI
jgi:hypothetical protein